MKPLILWGGEDVYPGFYGADPHPKAGPFNQNRDVDEISQVERALLIKQPIVGVCRGAQLLCVMNGGTLWQHSLGHRNNDHALYGPDGLICNSAAADHHQIMRPVGNHEVLAWDDTPTYVYNSNNDKFIIARVPEVVWWPDTKCLGIQPHPEWEKKGSCFLNWINSVIKEKGIYYVF